MSDPTPRLPAHFSLEQLRKQAKELLREYHAGDEAARTRFTAVTPHRSIEVQRGISLADAQFVLAREFGFDSWAGLKRYFEESWQSRLHPYQRFAEDLVAVFQTSDAAALERIHEILARSPGAELLRKQVLHRLSDLPGRESSDGTFSLADARLFVARVYGFGSWMDLGTSITQPPSRRAASVHGVSTRPPFYRIRWKDRSLEPRPPLSTHDWEEIFEVMRANGITALHAGGQMTDAVLARLAELDLVNALDLEASGRVTDEGLQHLAAMPRLERLNLSGCDITDEGLKVLSQLPALREFYLYHHGGVSDAGLTHLAFCQHLERVDLLGCRSGDGVVRALTGKPKLRHFKSGNFVTDAGLAFLQEFPVFRSWQGGEPRLTLVGFSPEPNFLLLRGQFTDHGMANLQGLEGLFGLNLDDSRLSLTAAGIEPLAALPHLEMLGFDATDETMRAIASLPHLRMLMCQDTRASDAGFIALSRSRTIEYIWGRRCERVTGPGFRALSQMPALRGLSVSCKNVDDAALSVLPDFPALREIMPIGMSDEGFRHVGLCNQLEALWCMYCRDTGDSATKYIADLKLKAYYAGETQITDRSPEILSRMESLERLTFSACGGVTNSGIASLAALPHLRELSLEFMPGITRAALASIPAHVRVNFET